MLKKSLYFISIVTIFLLFSSYARAEVDGEVQYILAENLEEAAWSAITSHTTSTNPLRTSQGTR